MNNEKVKNIKKVLEEGKFNTITHHQKEGKPIKISFADILTLINELEGENERLVAEKQKVLEYMKTDNYAKLKKEDMYWGYQMGICMLEHEIDRQKEQIAELEKEIEENAFYAKGYAQGIKNTYEVVIPDKLKQFTEKLKGKAIRRQEFIGELAISDVKYVKVKDIDETLKEFI